MPYRLQYFDAPKDESIPVLPDMPDEYEKASLNLTNCKMGDLKLEHWGKGKEFHCYRCPHCNGWILGEPNQYEVNTLNPHQLAGRQGTVYHCKRCGREIGFFGIVS